MQLTMLMAASNAVILCFLGESKSITGSLIVRSLNFLIIGIASTANISVHTTLY